MAIDPSQIRIDTQPKRQPIAPRRPNRWPWVIGAVGGVVLIGIGYAITPRVVANSMAQEIEGQYQMLMRSGASDMELAVRASAAAELHLQAHDEESYQRWKAIADRHARAAGLPAFP